MLNSGILDVAIGLVFIFLLLSPICSAINEMIEARLKIRAGFRAIGFYCPDHLMNRRKTPRKFFRKEGF